MNPRWQGTVALAVIAFLLILARWKSPKFNKDSSVKAELETAALPLPAATPIQESPSVASERSATLAGSEIIAKQYELGLHRDSWAAYTRPSAGEIAKFGPSSIKVIFEIPMANDMQYLIDVKRAGGAGGSRKDAFWEFAGGQVDNGEDPIQALLRELSEEDNTGILGKEIQQALAIDHVGDDAFLFFRNIELKNGEKQTILLIPIAMAKVEVLLRDFKPHKEIYSFETVNIRKLDIRKKKHRVMWTPRSQKILDALRGEP